MNSHFSGGGEGEEAHFDLSFGSCVAIFKKREASISEVVEGLRSFQFFQITSAEQVG